MHGQHRHHFMHLQHHHFHPQQHHALHHFSLLYKAGGAWLVLVHAIEIAISESQVVLGVARWRRGRQLGRAAGRQGVLLEPPCILLHFIHFILILSDSLPLHHPLHVGT